MASFTRSPSDGGDGVRQCPLRRCHPREEAFGLASSRLRGWDDGPLPHRRRAFSRLVALNAVTLVGD